MSPIPVAAFTTWDLYLEKFFCDGLSMTHFDLRYFLAAGRSSKRRLEGGEGLNLALRNLLGELRARSHYGAKADRACKTAFWALGTTAVYSSPYVLWLQHTRFPPLTPIELAAGKKISERQSKTQNPPRASHTFRRVKDEHMLSVLARELKVLISDILHAIVKLSGPGPCLLVNIYAYARLCNQPGFHCCAENTNNAILTERRNVLVMATQLWTNLSGQPIFNFSLTDFSRVYNEMVKGIGHGEMDRMLTQPLSKFEKEEQLRAKERIKSMAEELARIQFQSLSRPVQVRSKLLRAYRAMNALSQTEILQKHCGGFCSAWWIRYVAR
ncbi:hypothetical protein QFC24_000503 [Naganishia onofrii]|uniref:Uncharacterized protein n=1 Tax=Naganishia onofrii TaxID=1851511 RepID=A0ACC2XX07_9TREE|nr:hypothetical protein QFC24_000503 [Naganishia onofrii]